MEDDGEVSERGGGAGEFAESSPEPLRLLKHLVGMLLSSHIRQYPEIGGALAGISEEGWGDMATRFDDVKRAFWRC